MQINTLILSSLLGACFLFGTTLSATPLKITCQKNSVRFTGSSLTVTLWNTSNEIALTNPRLRLGGTCLFVNGKIPPKKNAPFVSGESPVYHTEDHPGVTETYSAETDGTIRCSITGTGNRVETGISLLSEYFNSTRVEINSRSFEIKAPEKGETFRKELWNAPAERIVFFPDFPEKRFEILPGKSINVRFLYTNGKYGLNLRLSPAGEQTDVVTYSILPGMKNGMEEEEEKKALPAEYHTRCGPYDFWKEDRLRLPDNHEKNLLQNNSFEQGMLSLFFHHYTSGGFFSKELWKVKPYQISSEEAFHGRYSLRIESDAPSRCIRSAIATHPVILAEGDYTFSLYAKTTRPGTQTLILTLPNLPPGANIFNRKTWKEYRFPLTASWKRFSIPVPVTDTLVQFFLLSASSGTDAFCYVDAMQLERGKNATSYAPPCAEGRLISGDPGNFLEYGRITPTYLEVSAPEHSEGSVNVTIRDFFGTIRFTNRFTFHTNSTGKTRISLPLENFPRGIFVMENNYRLKNGAGRYEFLRFSVMNFLENKHRHKKLFSNAYIDPYGNFQIFPEVLERYKKIGIGSRSGIANNGALTNLEGLKYGVEPVTSWVSLVERGSVKNGKNAAVTLYIPENIVWYSIPEKKEREVRLAEITLPCHDPAAFQRITEGAAKVSAASPWIQAWSNLGEAEGRIPEFAHSAYASEENFRNYVDFEIAVAKGLKQGNPEALIGTSATSCLREDRIKNLDRFLTLAGNRFRYDCFFIHTYREAPEYPDLDSDFQRLFEMLAHHGYQKEPIFCSEGMHWKPYKMTNLIPVSWIATPWGPFSYDMGNQERLASAWRARHWLIGLKYHGRIKVMNSSTNFWGFEMDPALTPFATQKISNTLGRLLGNATFRKEIRFSPKTRCYLFEDEQKRPVSALWSCDPDIDNGRKSAPELLLKELPQCSLFDLMEEETTLQKGKNLTLKLSPFPVFLRGQPGSEQDLLTVLQNSALKTPGELAIASSFRLLSPSSGAFLFDNGTRSTFSAIIKIKGRKVPVELAFGQKKTVPLELPLILTADKLSFEDFSIPVQQTRPYPDTIRLRENFFGILAKHIQSPIRIDGSLEDWKGIPAIPITGRMSGAGRTGKGGIPANTDFSANMKIAWDRSALYLAVEVKDDIFSVKALPLREGWKNDSLQIYLDTLCDARSRKTGSLDGNDYSYGVYFEKDSLHPKVWLHHVPDMQLIGGMAAVKINMISPHVKAAWKRTLDGYIYEIAFPASGVQPLKLSAGEYFGMSLMLNDQDGGNEYPASHLIFGGSSVNPNRHPETWPLIYLVQ